MPKKYLLLGILFFTIEAHAQITVQYTISKPYCMLNFLEVSIGQARTSRSIYNLVADKTQNDPDFKKICGGYSEIEMHSGIVLGGYPKVRVNDFNIFNLLVSAAVRAKTIPDFQQNAYGLLPNIELQKLVSLMRRVEPFYDKLIWNESEEKLKKQLQELKKYDKQIAATFAKINKFYNSTWQKKLPFTVALFPILGTKGGMLATPHVNALCLGVLVDTTQYELKTSIVLHEMCHLLYKEQSKIVQNQLEQYFLRNPSEYAKHAYGLLDEGLATAIGNAWAYKNITGKLLENAWYGDDSIDKYAKDLYPLVNEYFIHSNAIDSQFVTKAVKIFEKTFPFGNTDYSFLLYPKVNIMVSDDMKPGELFGIIYSKFNLLNASIEALNDKQAIEKMRTDESTQLIVINSNQEKYWQELKTMFKELDKVNIETSTVLSFFDTQKRPIIILFSKEKNGIEPLLAKMKALQHFDKNKIIQAY
jgi:hypothetical protein